MKNLFKKGAAIYIGLSRKTSAGFNAFVNYHGTTILFVLGLTSITLGLANISWAVTPDPAAPDYDPAQIRQSVALLFQLIEGSFGALIMVVAGIGAIIAAAFGAYRAAVGMLVVAVGAFILRALVSLFFGTFDDAAVIPGAGKLPGRTPIPRP